MSVNLQIVNAFLEDSGLIIATAYLLAHGNILAVLYEQRPVRRRRAINAGLILGAISISEYIFPNDRYPYVADTMITAMAAVLGGPIVGSVCALVAVMGAFLVHEPGLLLARTVSIVATLAVASLFRRKNEAPHSLINSLVAGMSAQSVAIGARILISFHRTPTGIHWPDVAGVLANGFSMVLMTMVFNDAWLRANSERNRLEAERFKALATQAELVALRARIHPHFLYNVLSSIAGLCVVAPQEARHAAISLGDLMRRTLEATAQTTIPLKDELENVSTYIAIEKNRLGDRLCIDWRVDAGCRRMRIPPFSIQTLVENAVKHGIAPIPEPGTIVIHVRRYSKHVLIAVQDDGAGMAPVKRLAIARVGGQPTHGLQILTNQLDIMYGRSARLRVFSRVEQGTVVAFAIPINMLNHTHPAGSSSAIDDGELE